ncbi:dihydroxyacetone kinase subunit DhaK [Actinorugispora endophytica]|uniref:phosphoenolpyruvate--glycerone phosphotransferase n=1 Tax=Actinorugispora endophytica TaxID=1605990 RepID=A0A4R6UUN9_9ACTN|nr:dihydroxyacetone kinase subunit DhaK [Actinorugispora endophytica]TDQ47204.1 dihydroxyacetone kinase DhaK subunit [Actinorugispora endophytica]
MKKFLNSPDTVIDDALAGIAAAHPGLAVDTRQRIITRARPTRPGRVALVSGGGSGHEPLHGGFVGTGMLDAACPGEVFTSPVPDQVLAAATAVDSGAGVVLVVKNYTGDVMNFEMAAELAEEEGVRTATVLVDDDVAVRDSTFTAGRRGTGATLFVEKIAGALAEQGGDLQAVADIGRRVNAASRSFAVALTACTTPASGRPGFDLADDEIEVGIGIHGEPGRSREKLLPARDLADLTVRTVLEDLPLSSEDPAIVMLNGMGGTPLLELYLLFGEVAARLSERGVTIARSLVGNYVTSLDMAGASLTVCRADDRMLELWDAPVSTPALRWGL